MAFSEKFSKKTAESDVFVAKMSDSDVRKPKFIGEVHDVLVDVATGERTALPISYNTVVDNCSKLIASLIKRHPGYEGALYWEVGSGLPTWEDNNPPSPSVTDSQLLTPVYRKPIDISDIVFINDSNEPTEEVTNRIQIVVTFRADEANGYLREFGLFGGGDDCKREVMGSGLMINRKTHGVIYKTSGMELQRTLRLTF